MQKRNIYYIFKTNLIMNIIMKINFMSVPPKTYTHINFLIFSNTHTLNKEKFTLENKKNDHTALRSRQNISVFN